MDSMKQPTAFYVEQPDRPVSRAAFFKDVDARASKALCQYSEEPVDAAVVAGAIQASAVLARGTGLDLATFLRMAEISFDRARNVSIVELTQPPADV